MSGLTNERPFVFRQFEVKHHHCAHKVGFDGVLLGAWARFNTAGNILDIGTGSGLIALMAAQQNPSAHITAIETDESSAAQARNNFAHSPWSNRFTPITADFLQYKFLQPFDHLVTNPPFYVNRIPAKGNERNTARHFTQEQLELFIHQTTQCLAPGGVFSIVIPWREWSGFKTVLLDAGYWTKRECTVFTRDPQTPERILLECCLHKCEKESTTLNIYDPTGKYSQEYIKLTSPYYLNF